MVWCPLHLQQQQLLLREQLQPFDAQFELAADCWERVVHDPDVLRDTYRFLALVAAWVAHTVQSLAGGPSDDDDARKSERDGKPAHVEEGRDGSVRTGEGES